MRIAVIAPPWVPVPPSACEGTETCSDTLARRLVDAAFHRTILAARNGPPVGTSTAVLSHHRDHPPVRLIPTAPTETNRIPASGRKSWASTSRSSNVAPSSS